MTAQVVMNTDEAGSGDGGFVEAREFTWFDERPTSFSTTKWSGEPVGVGDRDLFISCSSGAEATFTPDRAGVGTSRIVVKLRDSGAYPEADVPTPDGPAAVSAAVRTNGRTELVVWGNGVWNSTGIELTDDTDIDVAVELDFPKRRVQYLANETVLGTYDLADSVNSVSTVSFRGFSIFSEFGGMITDANLVSDAKGTEYASYDAAKAAGATGVLSPLWFSTWNLAGGSGTLDVKDPDGLVTFTGASKVLKSETQPDGSERKWYAEANDADIAAGAAKYIQTTVDLGLAKAITDDSVVKIGDYLVANGEMSFVVEIDDVVVAKETVKNLVEVRATMEAGIWTKPSDDEIDFRNGKVIVTPNKGGASGFARVKIPAS